SRRDPPSDRENRAQNVQETADGVLPGKRHRPTLIGYARPVKAAALFRRKPVDAAAAEVEGAGGPGLRRGLGAFDLTLLGVGAIVGAGIFSGVGMMAAGSASHPGAGPALVLSYLLTAAVCGLAALCYAEIAAMVPVAGSAYTYAYVALGELFAW